MRFVPVMINQLTEDGETTVTKEVEHGVCDQDIAFHRLWLLTLPRKDIRDSTTLWNDRHNAFPQLEFLDAVEYDLRGLQRAAFMQVVAWLGRMNDAVALWDPANAAVPQYPPHTTAEGEERRRYFLFSYKKVERCFHMHGRFTPGAGRIHFWLSSAERKVVIGYIGPKVLAKLAR
jgi:hypothetical protein